MEDYFNPSRPLHDLLEDKHTVLGYYVGFTESDSPSSPSCPHAPPEGKNIHLSQPNQRFFWHVNKNAPYKTEPLALYSSNVVPSPDFLRDRWARIMDKWGQSMKNAYVLNPKSYISMFRINFPALRILLI